MKSPPEDKDPPPAYKEIETTKPYSKSEKLIFSSQLTIFERVAGYCICMEWFGFLIMIVQFASIHKYIAEELDLCITMVIFLLIVSMWFFPKFTSNFVARLSKAGAHVYTILGLIYFTRVFLQLPETGKWRELSRKVEEVYAHFISFTMLAIQFHIFKCVHVVIELVQEIEAEKKAMNSKKKDISIV
ncbi:hypothetical protein GCK72_009577 [Caenorhabditis remanei]|uniref:Uncharacterized protein n=1 Tax=Caenorhabditis remanei TaxID=31234 RepID=A0A6A5H2S3_CAERE|nr:hypothetical protein GCK72_009577 [Caenorhabditis remanei]KAF1761321.1 hypothetical protein GCK72_009577 [Caenorhabditis remanei]